MVRDGYFYALGCGVAAALAGWLTAWHWLALVPLLPALFFLWFFRDPGRQIPQQAGAIVSVADGKVTEVAAAELGGRPAKRVSVFLSVFDVHVNRAPADGVVTRIEYRKGDFRNAMSAASAELNEQSICTLRTAEGHEVVFKQIAGLLARRIVCRLHEGDSVARGERFGLIKFGSRCDVIFPASAKLSVKVGDRVKGGSSILCVLPVQAVNSAVSETRQEVRQ
jgi:phosphatidylserine decarboxylase